MEEILASIRRIIADDQLEALDDSRPEQASEHSPLKSVLDLTERQVSPKTIPASPSMPTEMVEDSVGLTSAMDEQEEASVMDFVNAYKFEQSAPHVPAARPVPDRRALEPTGDEVLLSRAAGASVSDAFGRLGATVTVGSPKTLEDIAKEMLRPMLKAWLDDNLPCLVERLVQAEIERVSRSRG